MSNQAGGKNRLSIRHLFENKNGDVSANTSDVINFSGGGYPFDLTNSFNKVTQGSPIGHELVDRRIIRITGGINEAVAANVISQIHFLEAMDPSRDIELRINSPGGMVTAGLAIYDAMQGSSCDIRTVCEGMCASMAAVLLSAGAEGKRYALPSSTIMLHGASGATQGTVRDMKDQLEYAEMLQGLLIDRVVKHTGKSPKEIEDMFEAHDHFLRAEDAMKLGVVDSVSYPKPLFAEPKVKPPRRGPADGRLSFM